jgi:hypothetical protein
MIAGNVFNMLYFGAFLFFLFWRPNSIFISMIVDTSFLGFLWLFNIATTGSMTAQAPYFGNWYVHAHLAPLQRYSPDLTVITPTLAVTAGEHNQRPSSLLPPIPLTYSVGRAAIAFGWLSWFLITGLLVLKVTYTLMHYGMSMDTWKTPFNELVLYGVKGTGLAGGRQGSSSGSGSRSADASDARRAEEGQRQMSYTHSGSGSVGGSERMQTPASKPEMGEYFPVRQ